MSGGPALAPAASERVGLFDFRDHDDLVRTLARVLGRDEAEVHERLFREALQTGWNVSRAAEEFGLVPHVYGEAMDAFYRHTDAFVFELAVVHQTPYCQTVDRRVAEAVAEAAGARRRAEVLVLGDGIGTDSLRFALDGHSVTYFEFEGHSSALARLRFERAGVADRIVRIHELERIPEGRYDVVVNREVLEHVRDPAGVVGDVWRYLRPGGTAVVTESFARVEPEFPTHLAENAKYAGQTPRLFVDAGFRVRRIYPDGRPMVFQKTTRSDRDRYRTLPRPPGGVLRRLFRRLAARVLPAAS